MVLFGLGEGCTGRTEPTAASALVKQTVHGWVCEIHVPCTHTHTEIDGVNSSGTV